LPAIQSSAEPNIKKIEFITKKFKIEIFPNPREYLTVSATYLGGMKKERILSFGGRKVIGK